MFGNASVSGPAYLKAVNHIQYAQQLKSSGAHGESAREECVCDRGKDAARAMVSQEERQRRSAIRIRRVYETEGERERGGRKELQGFASLKLYRESVDRAVIIGSGGDDWRNLIIAAVNERGPVIDNHSERMNSSSSLLATGQAQRDVECRWWKRQLQRTELTRFWIWNADKRTPDSPCAASSRNGFKRALRSAKSGQVHVSALPRQLTPRYEVLARITITQRSRSRAGAPRVSRAFARAKRPREASRTGAGEEEKP